MNYNDIEVFLKDNNAFELFYQIIYFKYQKSVKDYSKTVSREDMRYFIRDSFIWGKIHPGIEYWTDLDNKFQELVKEKLKENFGK